MQYRRIYLNGYSYFITMTTYQRKPLLIEHIDLLRKSFAFSKKRYAYHIDAIVILPDHLHMIITPDNAKEYSQIIRYIKRNFVYGLDGVTKEEAKLRLSESKLRRGHSGIWQDRFYEHTIRDEKDYLEKINYMKNNPVKHGLVETSEEWEYSSFK